MVVEVEEESDSCQISSDFISKVGPPNRIKFTLTKINQTQKK